MMQRATAATFCKVFLENHEAGSGLFVTGVLFVIFVISMVCSYVIVLGAFCKTHRVQKIALSAHFQSSFPRLPIRKDIARVVGKGSPSDALPL